MEGFKKALKKVPGTVTLARFAIRFLRICKLQLKRALLDFYGRLFPELNKNYELSWVVFGALMESKNPVRIINYYSIDLSLPVQTLWLAFKRLKAAQAPEYDIVLREYMRVGSEELSLLFFARKITEDPGPTSFVEIEELVRRLESAPIDIKSKSTVKSVVASALIEKCDLESLESRLHRVNASVTKLTDHQKVRLMARYFNYGDLAMFLAMMHRIGPVGREAMLKVDQMYFSLNPEGEKQFKKLEKGFCKLPFKIAERYQADLKPIFSQISHDKNFLAACYDPSLIINLKKIIMSKLQLGQPLSFIRAGDGECYGLADQINVDQNGELRQEIHWWGEKLDTKLRQELQVKFRDALSDATILGIPTVRRLIKDFNLINKGDYEINSLISRIFCVIRGVSPFLKDKIIVEDQSNLYLFRGPFFHEIFSAAKKVVVVSGLNSDLVRRWAPQTEKLECIEIPTHRLLKNGDVGGAIAGILPNVYKGYLELIREHSGPGVVFLVSGGFIGKIFIAEAARGGSVALDVGQSLVLELRSNGSIA